MREKDSMLRRGMVALAACVAVVGVFGAAQAWGAANSLIATATNVTPPDELKYPSVKIEGQITAGRRFAYRQCKVDRPIHIDSTRISGVVKQEGDTYGTTRSGHFDYGPTNVDYGGTDSLGYFSDGYIPYTGGFATFFLSTPKIKVGKDRLGIRTYTCRPLSLTIQVAIPPRPGGVP